MSWQLVYSYVDYVLQFRALRSDPIYRTDPSSAGSKDPILLIPGFLTGDWSLQVMSNWLTRRGHKVYPSTIGWNIQCPHQTSILLKHRLASLFEENARPLIVIGHSLGGVLARFLSIESPQYVRHAIALGSPIDGSMRVHPLVPLTFRALQKSRQISGSSPSPCAQDLRCSCPFTTTVFAPLPQTARFSALYSRQDEIVHWQSCIDPHGDNYEISGLHMGLIVNPEVYRTLASILTSPVRSPVLASKTRPRLRSSLAFQSG